MGFFAVFSLVFACITMSERNATKRKRSVPLSVEDVMFKAQIIMEKDPFKDRAPSEENRSFRALFGCDPAIVLKLWNMLEKEELLPQGGGLTHLLWTFMYCKTYAKWKTMRRITNTDPKTLRKWIKLFLASVSLLEGDVVSANCYVVVIA